MYTDRRGTTYREVYLFPSRNRGPKTLAVFKRASRAIESAPDKTEMRVQPWVIEGLNLSMPAKGHKIRSTPERTTVSLVVRP